MMDLHLLRLLLLLLPLLKPSAMSGAVGTSRGKSRTGAMSAESARIRRRRATCHSRWRSILCEALTVVLKRSFSSATFFFTCCLGLIVQNQNQQTQQQLCSQKHKLLKHTKQSNKLMQHRLAFCNRKCHFNVCRYIFF